MSKSRKNTPVAEEKPKAETKPEAKPETTSNATPGDEMTLANAAVNGAPASDTTTSSVGDTALSTTSDDPIITDDEEIELDAPAKLGADEERPAPADAPQADNAPVASDSAAVSGEIRGTTVTDAPLAGLGEAIQLPGSGDALPYVSRLPDGLIAVEIDVPYLAVSGYATRDLHITPTDAETLRDLAAGLDAVGETLDGRKIDMPIKALEWLLARVRASVDQRRRREA